MKNEEDITLKDEEDLEQILKEHESVFVLFYASWCGFSMRFLPIFTSCALHSEKSCYCLAIDDNDFLCKKYSLDVYPTVLYFQKGKVAKRLDGIPGEGLNEKQLMELMKTCSKTTFVEQKLRPEKHLKNDKMSFL
jgi:hypothetical protein